MAGGVQRHYHLSRVNEEVVLVTGCILLPGSGDLIPHSYFFIRGFYEKVEFVGFGDWVSSGWVRRYNGRNNSSPGMGQNRA
jgi:hypothetical protein